MLSDVCDESNASPIEGKATLATARLRFATAAPSIRAISTKGARSGRESALAVGAAGSGCVLINLAPSGDSTPLPSEQRVGSSHDRPSQDVIRLGGCSVS